MRPTATEPGRGAALALVALAAGLTACNKVGREEFNDTVAEMRAELASHDERITANQAELQVLRGSVDELRNDLDDLRNDFQVQIDALEEGLRFAAPVHFAFDDARVRASDQALLDRFSEIVAKYYPGALVTVEGFADPAGPAEYNRRLSRQRADNVRLYLVQAGGLDAAALRTVGYGETRQVRPGAMGPGERGWENRRVAFVVEYAGAKTTPADGAGTGGVSTSRIRPRSMVPIVAQLVLVLWCGVVLFGYGKLCMDLDLVTAGVPAAE